MNTSCVHATPRTTTELVINGPAWEAALRPQLLNGPGRFAVGRVRCQSSPRRNQLRVDRIEIVDQLPSGHDRPPLDDWCCLHLEFAPTRGWSPRELIERLAPEGSQTLTTLVVKPPHGKSPCTWDGALRQADGRIVSIDRVRVVGPGLMTFDRDAKPAEIPVDELERYSRTIGVIGIDAFRKLRHMTVTIVGAGRAGAAAAEQFAALGAGQIRLVDPDLLELSNLNAAPGLRRADVGRAKVRALGRQLLAHRPDLHVTCFDRSVVEGSVAESLRSLASDLFVTAVDRDTPRLAVSLLARETLTPHLDIGTQIRRDDQGRLQFSGDVRLFLPGGQGCTRCCGGYADDEATLYELAAPPGAMQRGRPVNWRDERAGSLVSLNAICVGAGVQMFLDLLAGNLRTSCWQRFAWLPGEGLQSDSVAVTAVPGCSVCEA